MIQDSHIARPPEQEADSHNYSSAKLNGSLRPLQVITVAGGKGGIGKTMICAGLSVALAEAGSRVVLVDADLGGANLHTMLGMYMPGKTLHDFISRLAKTLDEIALPTSVDGLRLICGAPGIVGAAHIEYWEKLKMIRHLRKLDAEFVVVDIGAGMSLNEIDLFNAGDIPIVIANPEPTSIQECYNFLKVAIFRRLRREFADSPLVMALLDQCKDPSHASDRRLLTDIGEQVLRQSRREGVRFFKMLNDFTPKLILNRVFDDRESRDGLALQMAVQDLLRVRLDYWGYMNYDPSILKAVREMRPQDVLAAESRNRQRFWAMVRKYLLGEDTRYRSPGVRVILPIIERLNKGNGTTRICSTQCPLWDHCQMQQGGLPCRVPDEEFAQRVADWGEKEAEGLMPRVQL